MRGAGGPARDNATAEAFYFTVRVGYIHRHEFGTRAEARLEISTWIVNFSNLRRRHSARGPIPTRNQVVVVLLRLWRMWVMVGWVGG